MYQSPQAQGSIYLQVPVHTELIQGPLPHPQSNVHSLQKTSIYLPHNMQKAACQWMLVGSCCIYSTHKGLSSWISHKSRSNIRALKVPKFLLGAPCPHPRTSFQPTGPPQQCHSRTGLQPPPALHCPAMGQPGLSLFPGRGRVPRTRAVPVPQAARLWAVLGRVLAARSPRGPQHPLHSIPRELPA